MPKKPEPVLNTAALDAEKTIIGLLLAYPGSRPKILPIINVDEFQKSKNRKIFQIIADLNAKGQDIDYLLVWDVVSRLQDNDIKLSELVEFTQGLPEILNTDSYVRVLKDYRNLRRLHQVVQEFDGLVNAQISPRDIIADVQDKLLEVERQSPILDDVPKIDAIVDALGGVFEILHPTISNASIPTHLTRWDALCNGGLEPGTLTIIAGIPSSGKTSLAMCMAQNIAEDGTPVAMFSLEMAKKSLIDRMVCVKGDLDFGKYRARKLGSIEESEARRALGIIYDLPLFIDDKSFHSMGDLSRKIDRLVHKHGVRVCFLDYVQMLTAGLRQKGDRRSTTEILGEAVETLKSIGKRNNIAMVLLSQLNRESSKRSGDKKPMMSDLKDSSTLEQAADLIAFCYREFQIKMDQAHLRDYCEIIVSKSRNGMTGVIPMRFIGQVGGRFENL